MLAIHHSVGKEKVLKKQVNRLKALRFQVNLEIHIERLQ